MRKVSFSIIVCWFFLFTALLTALLAGKWKDKIVLTWDASTYYLAVPAFLLYHDPARLDFYKTIDSLYRPSGDFRKYAITPYSLTGKKIIKYPLGVSVFEIPAFAIAYLYCLIDKNYPADGWSEPFQLAVAISSLFFVFLGLLYLRRFLRTWFSDTSTAITLLILSMGTNLFHYSSLDPGISHPYLFFLFSMVLYHTQRWHTAPSFGDSVFLGLAIGMALITRPTGVLILIVPLLWSDSICFSIRNKLMLFGKEWKKIATAFAFFLIPLSLQLFYWKFTTGFWLYYSYEEEGFKFTDWHLVDGLFSYRKGWFVYTPLALLGFIGMVYVWLSRELRFYLLPFTAFFIPLLYVTFTWWMWWYGGGFGSRAMVESLSLLAFPMAALCGNVFHSRLFIKVSFILILVAGFTLNLFQSWQYSKGIIHWDSMNKPYYWRVFGKTKITQEDLRLLTPPG